MDPRPGNSILQFIPEKPNKDVYFPSCRYVYTKPDCKGIVQTNLYDDVIVGKSILGYNVPLKLFNNNRGQRIAHSTRCPSVMEFGQRSTNFTTSNQESFINYKVSTPFNWGKPAAVINNRHTPFCEKELVTDFNEVPSSFYSSEYFDKGAVFSNDARQRNKNRMISSASLQNHLLDSRFIQPQISTAYRESIDQLGEDRISNYRTSLEPNIDYAANGRPYRNYRKVSGNVILSRIRRDPSYNQMLIN